MARRHGEWVVVVMPGRSLVAFTAAGGHCDVGDDYGINTGARLHQQRRQWPALRTGLVVTKGTPLGISTHIGPIVTGRQLDTWVVVRSRRALGLSPEDAGGVAVDLGEEVFDLVRGTQWLVEVEAKIAVAPVQGPRLVGGDVAQTGDRKARPFRPEVLAPGGAPLDDGEVSRGHLAFDAHLVAGVLGHPHGTPPLHACDVQLRQGHRLTSR